MSKVIEIKPIEKTFILLPLLAFTWSKTKRELSFGWGFWTAWISNENKPQSDE